METNMKFFTVLSIWLSCMVAFGLGRVIYPSPTHNYNQSLAQIRTVSWTLSYDDNDKYSYITFIGQIRNEMPHSGTIYGIPVLQASASAESKYLYVRITNSDGDEIVFGLNVINGYLLAYKTGDNSYFFNDSKDREDAMRYLFTNTKQAILTSFSGNYVDFERQGAGRQNTNIGIGQINQYITSLRSTTQPGQVAKACVCCIQMISEAARFRYIEDIIVEKGVYTPFAAGSDITTRENNWGDLSNGIQYADGEGFLRRKNKQNNLERTTVQLSDKTVAKVSEISAEMGLLQHV